jgi:hypothetical protein
MDVHQALSKGPPERFDGSCIVCLEGTDTALGFRGPQEFAAAGLQVLGVPSDQAGATIELLQREEPRDPDWSEWAFRVCVRCWKKAGIPGIPEPVLAVVGADISTVTYTGPPMGEES